MEVKHSLLQEVTFYGDFFGVRDVAELAKELQGLKLEENEIRQKVKDLPVPISEYFNGISKEDFIDLLMP